jgi:2-dehydro-3-deoxyphosphogluconate aldolase/(4S)-4-hydroxy-2-oxoglutarate aldolase
MERPTNVPQRMTTFDLLFRGRLVPVVVLDDPSRAKPLAQALAAGGLPIAEVTFRTPKAGDALSAMAEDPRMSVGAGTVITPAQVDAAVAAGARFVVSPGFSRAVVTRCRDLNVPVLPGVATASDLIAAFDAGLTTVKLFPAEPLGGISMLRALAAAFPQARFVPTGGISATNAASYLAEPAVLAVGGSWMVARELISDEGWDRVTRLTAEAVELADQAGRRGLT